MQDTERLLTYQEVMRTTGFRSRTSIWNHVRDHSFPAPLRIGRYAIRWRASDITAWVAALPEQHYREQPQRPAVPDRPGPAAACRRGGDSFTLSR